MTNFETMTIREAWGKLGRKLAILIPAKLVTWLEAPKREVKRQHPLTVLIVLLIGCLSTASVTNLFTRAEFHHPGISAYATGAMDSRPRPTRPGRTVDRYELLAAGDQLAL